jgi:hypothetical protein
LGESLWLKRRGELKHLSDALPEQLREIFLNDRLNKEVFKEYISRFTYGKLMLPF